MDTLRPECFYVEQHRQIYNAIRRLFQAGGKVDFVTVLNELVGIGAFTEAVSREEVFFDEYHQRYAEDLIEYAIQLRDAIPTYWA